MKCDASNGFAGWVLRDRVTGDRIDYVLWVDPDANEYRAMDMPARFVNGEVAATTHKVADITVDLSALTFWFQRAPATVTPLSPGWQDEQERTDQPCQECCQESVCRRTGWCAAHRGPFGERAP